MVNSSSSAFAVALLLSALPCMANNKKKNKNKNSRTIATCQSPQFSSAGTCPSAVLLRRIRVVYTDPDATDSSSDDDDDNSHNNKVVSCKKLVNRVVFIPPEYRFPLISETTSPTTTATAAAAATSLRKESEKPPSKRCENQPSFQDDLALFRGDLCRILPDDIVSLDLDGLDSPELSLDLSSWDSPTMFHAEEPLNRAVTCNSAVPMHGQEKEDQHQHPPPYSLHILSPCSVLETSSSGVVAGCPPCSTVWPLSPDHWMNCDRLFVPESCSTLAPVLSPLDLFNEGPYYQDLDFDFDQSTDWWLPVS